MSSSAGKMVRDIFRNDLCSFIRRSHVELNPDTPIFHNWHHEVIARKLEDVHFGNCRRLIINVPPRSLKSHSASIAFPAWALGHIPSKRIVCISYAQTLSDDLARTSRKLMASPFYKATFDTRIASERDTVSDFHTKGGGSRFSTSIGGTVTGMGGDLIIIDDPLKADEALSDNQRNNVNKWYDTALGTRINSPNTGSIIIVMQRLHANDLVAHVQEKDDWEVLILRSDRREKRDLQGRHSFRQRGVFTQAR